MKDDPETVGKGEAARQEFKDLELTLYTLI